MEIYRKFLRNAEPLKTSYRLADRRFTRFLFIIDVSMPFTDIEPIVVSCEPVKFLSFVKKPIFIYYYL